MFIKRRAPTSSQKKKNAMGVTPDPPLKNSHLKDYCARFGDSIFIICKDCSDGDTGSESK